MWRAAADHRAQGDHPITVAGGQGQSGGQWQLIGAGHPGQVMCFVGDTVAAQGLQRAGEQLVGNEPVEAGGDDGDRTGRRGCRVRLSCMACSLLGCRASVCHSRLDILDHFQAETGQAGKPGGCTEHVHFTDAQVVNDLRADAIGAQFPRLAVVAAGE